MRHPILIQTLILASLALPLQAKDRPFIDEADPQARPDLEETVWKEQATKLPELPKAENLVEFQVDDPNSRFRYFIDRSALQLGKDGVTRTLIVIRSASGAINTSFEGFHCGERRYKVYAYGGKKGLKAVKIAKWKRVMKSGYGNFRNPLYSHYWCDILTGLPFTPEQTLHAMQSNQSLQERPSFIDD
jgi:hypothetical protein